MKTKIKPGDYIYYTSWANDTCPGFILRVNEFTVYARINFPTGTRNLVVNKNRCELQNEKP
jgi:hypothetical protein